MPIVRWIGSLVVAACLLAAGTVRPAHAAELDPTASELAAAAKALAGKVLPRRHDSPAPEQRRSPAPLVAIVPPPADPPPLHSSSTDAVYAEASAHSRAACPARSARGPPA